MILPVHGSWTLICKTNNGLNGGGGGDARARAAAGSFCRNSGICPPNEGANRAKDRGLRGK